MAGRDTWSGLAWLLTLEHSLERTQRHLIPDKSGPVALRLGARRRQGRLPSRKATKAGAAQAYPMRSTGNNHVHGTPRCSPMSGDLGHLDFHRFSNFSGGTMTKITA
jgi:hypothetical protein